MIDLLSVGLNVDGQEGEDRGRQKFVAGPEIPGVVLLLPVDFGSISISVAIASRQAQGIDKDNQLSTAHTTRYFNLWVTQIFSQDDDGSDSWYLVQHATSYGADPGLLDAQKNFIIHF